MPALKHKLTFLSIFGKRVDVLAYLFSLLYARDVWVFASFWAKQERNSAVILYFWTYFQYFFQVKCSTYIYIYIFLSLLNTYTYFSGNWKINYCNGQLFHKSFSIYLCFFKYLFSIDPERHTESAQRFAKHLLYLQQN